MGTDMAAVSGARIVLLIVVRTTNRVSPAGVIRDGSPHHRGDPGLDGASQQRRTTDSYNA